MPLTLDKIAANTATVSMPYAGDAVVITYYPGRVTEKSLADIKILADPANVDIEANGMALNQLLVSLVKAWDLQDVDGSPFPLTVDRLAEIPFVFRAEVINAIFSDIAGNVTAAQTLNT